MRNLLNPKWLFIINTLPIVVLFVIFYDRFCIINTLLDEESLRFWYRFGLVLGIMGLLNFAYAMNLTLKKQSVHALYGILALLSYILFLYLYSFHFEELIPSDIPRWMVPENIFMYGGTFLMPTLVYSLLVLIIYSTSETKEHKAWINFLIAISVPLAGYLFSQIILPAWQSFMPDFDIHVILILIIAATIVFLFFLLRGILILATKKAAVWQKYQLLWKIPVTIIFPLLGLIINNGHLLNDLNWSGSGIFGDFNHYWFYILAFVNGLLICLPNIANKPYRLFLFIGRNITFAYTCYFFLVFLPLLPLSVIAILLFGAGFLMLTPSLLFVIQVHTLSEDFAYLKPSFSQRKILGISILSFCVIPACITATYLKDKQVLNETLAYLYSPDYSKQYHINKKSLQKTLDIIKSHKDRNWNILGGYKQPYLSSYFNWLVLDNLTLSETKTAEIEHVFFGKTLYRQSLDILQSNNVEITAIKKVSIYEHTQKTWTSWIDLDITNKNEESFFTEYATSFELPEGCWISDYYLYVGDRKEEGILAEKRSAMWVFSQIRNENRDPGILYYLSGNRVAFRIFPFAKEEVRKTGIEFIHKDPVTLTIDGHTIELGYSHKIDKEKLDFGDAIYISGAQKQTLKQVRRKPYFHFLVDVSRGKENGSVDFTGRIEKALANNPSLSENAQISFVNTYVNNYPLDKNWKTYYESQDFEGGFYLERAIRTTLHHAYKAQTYPVIVVVTDTTLNTFLSKDFSDFRFAFPENDLFFNLSGNGELLPHSLTHYSGMPLADPTVGPFNQTVLEYKLPDHSVIHLADNNKPDIVLKNDIFKVSEKEIKEKNWQSALIMQAKWMSQTLHPETSDKEWLNLVKYSFASKIMTPVTSYLVVENEAQKAILRKKQEQVLSSNKSLDLDENTLQMSEPNWLLLILLFGLAWWLRNKRK